MASMSAEAKTDATWAVWVKRYGHADYEVFEARALQSVSAFKQSWLSKAAPGVTLERVALRVVRAGAGEPTEDEEKEAAALRTPVLATRATLLGAGLGDGCSLLAVDVPPLLSPVEGSAPVGVRDVVQRIGDIERKLAGVNFSGRVPSLLFSPTAVAQSYRDAQSAGVATVVPQPTWFQRGAVSAEVADVIAEPPPPGALEADVKKHMERLAEALAEASSSSATVLLVGRSTVVSFGTRKPDLVGYVTAAAIGATKDVGPRTGTVAAASTTVFHIACLGDAKHRRRAHAQGQFTDEEKGHLLSFPVALLREQPWRAGAGGAGTLARVVAFLCDGEHIIFFQCTFRHERQAGTLHMELAKVEETPSLLLAGDGGAYLAGLVTAPLASLGYGVPPCVVHGEAAALIACLGAGATSVGYAATWRGRVLFAKSYDPTAHERVRARETTALRALRGVVGVVQLMGDGDGVLLLEPLGVSAYSLAATACAPPPPAAAALADAPRLQCLWRPGEQGAAAAAVPAFPPRLRLPGAAEFCDLLDALANVHAAGWVHRDPRPTNFFRDPAGCFFLADLGSAVRVGESAHPAVPFGFTHGPLHVLDALAAEEPLPPAAPADDLEQVARLVYAAQARLAAEGLPVAPEPRALAAFWRGVGELEPLATLLRLAAEAAPGTPVGAPAATVADADAARRKAFMAGIRAVLL